MTNLYDFLRRTLANAKANPANNIHVSAEDMAWMEMYLKAPMDEIHLQARPTGRVVEGEREMETHFQVAGDPADVFSLLCEAALANPTLWTMIRGCAAYLADHVHECDACMAKMREYETTPPDDRNWQFKPLNHTNG